MRAAKPWCVLRPFDRLRAQDEAIFFVAPTLDGRKGGPHPEPVEGRNPADPAPPINSHARKRGPRGLSPTERAALASRPQPVEGRGNDGGEDTQSKTTAPLAESARAGSRRSDRGWRAPPRSSAPRSAAA